MRHRKSISAKSVYRTGRGERKVSGERERGREQGTGIMRQQKQMVPATVLSLPATVLRARNKSKWDTALFFDPNGLWEDFVVRGFKRIGG